MNGRHMDRVISDRLATVDPKRCQAAALQQGTTPPGREPAAQPVAQMALLFPRRTACSLAGLGSKRRSHRPDRFRGR